MKKMIRAALGLAAPVLMLLASLPEMAQRYAGGDISLLPEYVKAGAQFNDHDGRPIAEILPWLHEQGMNAMRVRLFVNPKKYKELHQNDTNGDTRYDPNACQDLDYILPLCKDIVDAGFDLMLDFHYSDTWADPAKQWTPIDWEGLTDEQLYARIYDYTREVLTTLREAGVIPAFIQPGNEISYGMLWGPLGTSAPKKAFMGSEANWQRFGTLLNNAIKACREVCPDAGIVIHTERVAQTDVLANFYDKMASLGVDYDIIGLSYYPYFHGDMSLLTRALDMLQSRYTTKKIMIVETGYPYAWEVPGSGHDFTGKWQYSDAGQDAFARDLVATLDKYEACDGLFWWWMEYNAKGTSLSGWYNAPLFDSRTGNATAALKTICSYATPAGVDGIPGDSDDGPRRWYDLQGRPVDVPSAPGIYLSRDRKLILR